MKKKTILWCKSTIVGLLPTFFSLIIYHYDFISMNQCRILAGCNYFVSHCLETLPYSNVICMNSHWVNQCQALPHLSNHQHECFSLFLDGEKSELCTALATVSISEHGKGRLEWQCRHSFGLFLCTAYHEVKEAGDFRRYMELLDGAAVCSGLINRQTR